jgi:hypothetical protein
MKGTRMFLREIPGQPIELGMSLEQLKKIYLALFHRLHSDFSAIDELDADDMLLTIQTFLQRKAREAGVDCTNHADWEAFLGVRAAPSCAERFAGRPRD